MEQAGQISFERVAGIGRVGFHRRGPVSALKDLYQEGAAKIRLPRALSAGKEAVLINTAGGLTGGDRLSWHAEAAEGTEVTLTTPAAEKAYRCDHGEAQIRVQLKAAAGARIDWLPQETILFNKARLARHIAVELAGDARLLLAETVMFGRQAMGEAWQEGALRESWRVKRDGLLIHAEETRISPLGLQRPALGRVQLPWVSFFIAQQMPRISCRKCAKR